MQEAKAGLNLSLPRYLIAVGAPIVALLSRLGLVRYLGHPLPTYITFYPAVMLAALLGGLWPGLVATAVTALLSAYWVLPPDGFAVGASSDVVGLVLFSGMGVFMSLVAERYRRTQDKAAAYEKELALRESQEALQRTEERWAITLRSIGDAVLTTDAQGRITFLNPVAEALTGWSTEEAAGQPIANVFRIVNEETHHPAPDVVQQVLREGRTIALGNHTALITKAGREVPIEDSAAPINDSRGNVVGVVLVFHDVTERRQTQEALRRSEQRVRTKLESILSPEGDVGTLELEDVVDAPALQALMEDFHKLAEIPMAIIDVQGNVLVGVGWQDVCTKFHRVSSESCKHCIESDVELSAGVPAGEFKLYHCKNHMWDVATPIIVGGKHVGNVFTGQFFFEGETPDLEIFRAQARHYGFNEDAYLAALDRVPRLTRERLMAAMAYFVRVAEMISKLSYSNLKLARSLGERDALTASLRSNEARLQHERDLLQAVMDGARNSHLVFLDRDFNFVRVNEAYAKTCGYRPEEMIGKNHFALYPHAENEAIFAHVRDTGQPLEFHDKPFVFPDQPERGVTYWDWTLMPVKGPADRVEGLVFSLVETTERKQAEEKLAKALEDEHAARLGLEEAAKALAESEAKFRIMGEILPYGVWWCNERGGAEYVSQSFCDLLEMTPVEQKEFGWTRRLPPDEVEPMMKKWMHCIETGEDWDSEHHVLGPDGKYHTVLTRGKAVRDATGKIIGWAGINLNIDERKRIEQALQHSLDAERARAEELQTLMDAVPATVWIAHDDRGEFMSGNRAVYELLGLPFGVNVSRTAPEGQRPGNFRACRNGVEIPGDQLPVQRAARGEIVRDDEFELVFVDGTVRYLAGSATPLFDAEGKPRGAVSVFMDVTERKRAEEALIRSEKLASVGRMAAAIAHEINNPLAAVMNTLFLARTNSHSPQDVRRYLETADEELRRVAHLTRQSLGFYRESSAPQRLYVNEVLQSSIELLKSKTKSKRATIEVQCDGSIEMTGLSGELRQVFTNLLANSLDAVSEGGIIKVRVSRLCPDGHPGRLRISLADNGIGIDRAALPRLFEPFFTTKDTAGTGLGLWVSKQIVDKHGGTISVHSRTSGSYRGTTFSVVLPAEAAPASELVAAAAGA